MQGYSLWSQVSLVQGLLKDKFYGKWIEHRNINSFFYSDLLDNDNNSFFFQNYRHPDDQSRQTIKLCRQSELPLTMKFSISQLCMLEELLADTAFLAL